MTEAQMPERYAMHQGFDYDSMQPDPEGGYVSYSDHAYIVAALEQELAVFKAIYTQKINNLERGMETARRDALEEAARVCGHLAKAYEKEADAKTKEYGIESELYNNSAGAEKCAESIRALLAKDGM